MNTQEIQQIQELFFQHFPNSKAATPFTEVMARAALRHIEVKNKIRGVKRTPLITDEEQKRFHDFCKSRRPKSFYDLPEDIQGIISVVKDAFELYQGITIERLYVTGPFFYGYGGKIEDQDMNLLRQKIKGNFNFEFIDLYAEPVAINEKVFKMNDALFHQEEPYEKILIFDKTKFI